MKLVVGVANAKDILKKNRIRHIAEYQLQLEAWKKAYADYSEELKVWSQEQGADGTSTRRPQEPVKPEYYVDDYDKLINKLEIHVNGTIELDQRYGNEFEQIFENEFNWSGRFGSLSGQYVTSGYISSDDITNVRNS